MQVLNVKANGITLAVEDTGPRDAPPLILIRGQGSQVAHWPRALIEGFVAAGFRVIAFDNRDVGLSQRCPAADVPADADSAKYSYKKVPIIDGNANPRQVLKLADGMRKVDSA